MDAKEHNDIPAHFTVEPAGPETKAWEEVEAGRYMPRRTRGSFKGRALG
ncbi:MAG: hypothetical protein U0744_07555 [Gemmataceae bacterium]